ncbi:hypothetical protein ACXX84_03690 [Mycoplasma sp. AC157]
MAKPNAKILISVLALTALSTSIGTTATVFWNSRNNNQSDYTKAKVEANLEADKLLDENKKSNFKQKIDATTTIEEINAIKDEIANDLTTQLNEQKNKANALKDKLSNQEIKDKFTAEINDATTSAQLEAIKDRITKALKAEAQAAVNSLEKEAQKPFLNQKLESTNSPEEIFKIKEFAQVLLEAHLLIDKLESSDERIKFANELNSINDEDKAKVEEIIQKIKKAIEDQLAKELAAAKQAAETEISKLTDESKKQELRTELEVATTTDAANVIKDKAVREKEKEQYTTEVDRKKVDARTEISKLTKQENKDPLNTELDSANTVELVQAVIDKAIAKQQEELNEEKRKNHLQADKIQDNDIKTNLKSKVDSTTTFQDLNKVKQEIEKQLAKELANAKKEAEAEIAKLTNETKKEELTNELISANTIDEVKVIKSKAINEQEKEQARIIAKNEINKLAEGEEKTNLLNIVNNYNSTLKEITEAKETAQNSLATSLNEARTSIIKLVGHSEYDFLNQQIETNKENQAELKKIINESNVKFNEKVQEVREVIDSIEGSEVEENSEFKAKKEELINKLSLAPNVTKLEEIKNEATETREKQKDRLIKSYKPKLLHLIYKNLREGSEAKNQFSNTVNSATTFDELKTISDKVNKIIEDLIQKARETILILEGDDYEIAKANEILDSKDTRGANFQEYVEDHIIKYAISYVESKRSDAIYEVEHVIFERRQYYLEALRSKETKTIAKINALKEQALEEARLENEKQQNNPS